MKVEGEFEGEIKIIEVDLQPIKYDKVLRKTVLKNNETSGKIQLPHDYIDKEVVILLPKLKAKK